MAVLLAYHRLIEKDSQRVNYCWKASILIVLLVAIATSLVISFSMASLMESYDDNCFLGAEIRLVLKESSQIQINSDNSSIQSPEPNHLHIINKKDTTWSDPDFCEFLTYTPLVHALVGIIWLALYSMHGPGGEGIGSIIPKPWRIIIPSLVFFTICGISAIVCASFTCEGLADFCSQIQNNSEAQDCARLISQYSFSQSNDLVLPDKNYYLLTSFSWIWVGCYICGFLIMVMRVLLVVDFELIRVVISIVEEETVSGDAQLSFELLQESKSITSSLSIREVQGTSQL